jgi:adenosylhomocysteine nucleosidase
MLGIMGAMPEEVEGILADMQDRKEVKMAMRTFHVGKLHNRDCVVVFSRWGKVAAASTASILIHHFQVKSILFTGVAGGLHADVQIGDIVIGRNFYQHDMDARPLLKEFEIPLLGINHFKGSTEQILNAETLLKSQLAKHTLLLEIDERSKEKFGLHQPKLLVGDIASGDRFFASAQDKQLLMKKLPELLCVEMEGSAVAQVAYEHEIPFLVIRTISDSANDHSAIDFLSFIKEIASNYSRLIVRCLLQ